MFTRTCTVTRRRGWWRRRGCRLRGRPFCEASLVLKHDRTVRVPTASGVSRASKSCGSFFSMPLEFADRSWDDACPAPPCAIHGAPETGRRPKLPPFVPSAGPAPPNRRQHQHSTGERLFCPRPQELPFFRFAHQRAASSAPTPAATVAGVVPPPEPGLESRHRCSSHA